MAEHPITFTGESVRGILANRKSKTRRVDSVYYRNWKVGDLLWVQEKWRVEKSLDSKIPSYFTGWSVNYVDEYVLHLGFNDFRRWGRWRSPRFMPKWAARIWLEITAIRKERLQDITEIECLEEGCPHMTCDEDMSEVLEWYMDLWDSLNAKRGYGWDTNPEVKVISFKRVNK